MLSKPALWKAGIVALLFGCLVLAKSADAQESTETQGKPSDNLEKVLNENKALEQSLKQQIKNAEERLELITNKERTAFGAVTSYLHQIDQSENSIISANSQINSLQAEIDAERFQIESLQAKIDIEQKKIFNTLLIILKIKKKWDNLNVFYRAIGNQGLKERQALKIYAQRTNEASVNLSRLIEESKGLISSISRRKQLVENLILEESTKLQGLMFEKKQYEFFLEKITGEKTEELQRLGILKSNKQELDSLLSKLWQSYLYRKSAKYKRLKGFPNSGASFLEPPGPGSLVHNFGDKEEGISGSIYNGVIVRTPKPESEVTASYGGIVTFITTVRGFGNVVILDHGSSDYTVYGMLEKLFTDQGSAVRSGDIIGITSANPANSTFYFEVRDNNSPTDPLKLLKNQIWK